MNKRKWEKIMLVSLVLLALLISGFSVVTSSAYAAEPVKAQGGVVRIAMQQDMPNFNYWDLNSNTVWKSNVIGWNFESLMSMDYDGSAYPLLAKKVVFDKNTLTATIYLRKGVTFQDGVPMTAKDVIFSYCALRQGTTISGTTFTVPFDDNNDGVVSLQEIKHHVIYVNDYEIKISAKQPYSFFFLGTLGVPIIPEHIWKDHLVSPDGQPVTVDAHGYTNGIVDVTWNSDPKATIGTGWWMYGGGVRDSYRYEVPYKNYWGKNFRTPNGYPIYNANITELYFKIYTNLDTAILALETGQVDYIAWNIEPGKVPILQKDPNVQLHYAADNGYFYLAFNEKTRPANYIAFRHAVSHVIDKATAVQRYLGGFGQAGDSPEPPFFTAWYNASVQHYAYDLNIAKKILDGEKVVAPNGYVEQDPAWGEKFPVGPSGWRTLPDGTPMQPITLFTPPADYDPVRIKVGQGIAQNLRSLGINIVAKPVDFDTLVAYMQSYNYQMLELGWALSADPIGNLADILGPKSIQNTYGWWNASDPNPYYVNSGGVKNTLADKYSQDLATEFGKVINKAMTTFNVTKQIKYTKWAQDIETKAVAVNVLYYRLNVEATRTSWQGWVEWQGSVYNWVSLALLHKGKGGGGVVQTGKYLGIGVDVPGKVLVGNTVSGTVFVANSEGQPVKGAKVTFQVTNGLATVSAKSEYTDSNGLLQFSLTPNKAGFEILNITASYGDYKSVTKSVVIQFVSAVPNILSLNVKADKYSLAPGDQTKVTVCVVNQNGAPVAGAKVSVNPELVGYGSISPLTATTNANGVATFTYTAPSAQQMQSKYVDMHTVAKLVFSATKEGYSLSNTVTFQLVTYNDYPSMWNVLRIEKVSNWVVKSSSISSLKTTLSIHVFGLDGKPLAGKKVALTYSNLTYLNSPPNTVTTDSNGWANVTLQFTADKPTKVVRIHAVVMEDHSIGDSVDILYWNPSRPASVPLYAGHIYAQPFMDQGGAITYTVELYNSTGMHPKGTITIGTVVTATPDGQLVDMEWPFFATTWEYVGINIYGDYSDSIISAAGEWNGVADKTKATVNWHDWGVDTTQYGMPAAWNTETTWDYLNLFYGIDMEPFTITNGTGTFMLYGAMSSYRDLPVKIYVVTGGVTYYITNPAVNNFVMYGNQTFETEFAVQRAMNIVITSYHVDKPYVFAGQQMPISVAAMNQTDAMLSGVDVVAYNNAKWWKAQYPANDTITGGNAQDMIPTDSTSKEYNYTLSHAPVVKKSVTVIWFYMNNPYVATDDGNGNIMMGSTKIGTINYQTGDISLKFDKAPDLGFIIVKYSYTGTGTIMIDTPLTSSAAEYNTFILPDQSLSPAFGQLNILEATQIAVVPHQLFVTVQPTTYMVDLGGTISFTATVTDENGNTFPATVSASSSAGNVISLGNNEFVLETNGITAPSVLNNVELTFTINAVNGYLAGATKVTVIVRNMPPTLTISSVANGAVIHQDTLPVTGYAYDPDGISEVTIIVDGGSPVPAHTTPVAGGVQWSLNVGKLSDGNHTITVIAKDSMGVAQTQEITFQVKLVNGQSDIPAAIQQVQKGVNSSQTIGYVGIVLAIIALIIAIIAVARKPKPQVVEEVPEEEEELPEEELEEEETTEETTEESTEETSEEGGEEL